MLDVVPTTRLDALAAIGRAALDAADRTAFLPVAAREIARLLDTDATEIWTLDEDLLALSGVFRSPDVPVRSLQLARLAQAAKEPVREQDWLALPIPGEGGGRGVLALQRPGAWPADDLALAEAAATLVGVGLAAAQAGEFDESSRNQFLALLGHDLRSPLSNVRVGAQLARRNLDAGDLDSVREALTIIESQSVRLVARLEALLDAVAASGRRLMRLEPLDLGSLAESAIAPLALAALESGSGTRFELEIAPATPRVRGDGVQLGQVLEHVLDNAAKYAPGSTIRVGVQPEGGMVRLDVCDNGPGIRPEDVERIFMPFGRGHAGAGSEGYGLGLFLARNILAAHGGRIWIARTSRSGTCMALALPAMDDQEG